ncbi:MAG: HepT-like ribonuclease domain-containing protein [Clostridia bacterium]
MVNVKYLLQRMLEHCTALQSDVTGYCFDSFLSDSKTQRAAYMSLHQIGELAGRLPTAFRIRHEDVPWSGIRQVRNIISHEYIRIDLAVVWGTITDDIPPLMGALTDILLAIHAGNEPVEYEKD